MEGAWPGTQVEGTYPYTKLLGGDFTGGGNLKVGFTIMGLLTSSLKLTIQPRMTLNF